MVPTILTKLLQYINCQSPIILFAGEDGDNEHHHFLHQMRWKQCGLIFNRIIKDPSALGKYVNVIKYKSVKVTSVKHIYNL